MACGGTERGLGKMRLLLGNCEKRWENKIHLRVAAPSESSFRVKGRRPPARHVISESHRRRLSSGFAAPHTAPMVSAVVAVCVESESSKGVKARRAEPGRPADHLVGRLSARVRLPKSIEALSVESRALIVSSLLIAESEGIQGLNSALCLASLLLLLLGIRYFYFEFCSRSCVTMSFWFPWALGIGVIGKVGSKCGFSRASSGIKTE